MDHHHFGYNTKLAKKNIASNFLERDGDYVSCLRRQHFKRPWCFQQLLHLWPILMGSLFIGILVYFYVLHHNLWLVQTLELMFGYINTPNANLQKKKKLNLQNPQNLSIAMDSSPKVVWKPCCLLFLTLLSLVKLYYTCSCTRTLMYTN